MGLYLGGIAVAWAWQIPWLFIVSLGILGEELLETSVMIEVLRRAPAPRGHGPRRSTRRPTVQALQAGSP